MVKKLSSYITLSAAAVLFTGVAAAAGPMAKVTIPNGPDATDYHNHTFTLYYCGDTKTASCDTLHEFSQVYEDNDGTLVGHNYGPIDPSFENQDIRFAVSVTPGLPMAGGLQSGTYITTHPYAVTDQGAIATFNANSSDWQPPK